MGSTVILDLMGGVALLLWGLHMVHSGVVRAFGADLRRLLGIALQSRFRAFLAGAFVTALLQSSTATGLMAASFVTGGTLDLVPALAVMLGANVGTTLVVQILSFNITVVTPVLLLTGVIAFKRGGRTRTRDLGRAVIGIGLMLLALHIFLGALVTTGSVPISRALLGAVTHRSSVLHIHRRASLRHVTGRSSRRLLLALRYGRPRDPLFQPAHPSPCQMPTAALLCHSLTSVQRAPSPQAAQM